MNDAGHVLGLFCIADENSSIFACISFQEMVKLFHNNIDGQDVAAPTSVSAGDNVTVPDANVGKAAMAILGEATINAAWQTDDLNVGLVYNIKASNSTVTDTQPILAGVTGNTITIPAATLNEATVEAVAIQDPKKDTYGFFPLEFDETTYTTNASGDATLTIDSGVIDYLKTDDSLKGASNPQDLIIALSDGRVIVTTLTVS